MSINPTAISIASGIGITDRCLGEAGFKILVANDISQKAETVYTYNHEYENSAQNPTFIREDFLKKETVDLIVNIANQKLDGQSLDLLTAFLPPNDRKNPEALPSFINNLFIICTRLQPKMVILDQIKGTHKIFKQKFSEFKSSVKDFDYVSVDQKYDLQEHGIPNATIKNLTFLFHRALVASHQPKKIDFTLISQLPFTTKEALACVWGENPDEDQADKASHIPLHVNPVHFNKEDHVKLLKLISPIKQGGHIPKEEMKDDFKNSVRAMEDQPFPVTLSSRAIVGPFWSIHPKFHRGYTPFECVLLSTISDVPFELAPDLCNSTKIFARIADATSPRFLLAIFKRAISYLTDKKPAPLKLKHKFPSITYNNVTLYTGSALSPRITHRTFDTLIAKPQGNKSYLSYEYRQYLYNLIHEKLSLVISKHPTMQCFNTWKQILTFKMNKTEDREFTEQTKESFRNYKKSTEVLIEWLELLTKLDAVSLEALRETIESFFKEDGPCHQTRDKKNTNLSNFLLQLSHSKKKFDKVKSYNDVLKTHLKLTEFNIETEVLDFAVWKRQQNAPSVKPTEEITEELIKVELIKEEIIEEEIIEEAVDEDEFQNMDTSLFSQIPEFQLATTATSTTSTTATVPTMASNVDATRKRSHNNEMRVQQGSMNEAMFIDETPFVNHHPSTYGQQLGFHKSSFTAYHYSLEQPTSSRFIMPSIDFTKLGNINKQRPSVSGYAVPKIDFPRTASTPKYFSPTVIFANNTVGIGLHNTQESQKVEFKADTDVIMQDAEQVEENSTLSAPIASSSAIPQETFEDFFVNWYASNMDVRSPTESD